MKKTYEYEIVQDTNPTDPRDWDNIATMICFHNRYTIGDKHEYKSNNYNGWQELKEQIESDYKVLHIKPLYLYDHSGITISTSPFGCQWDSGQIGWVIIDEKRLQYITGDASGHNETNLEEIKVPVQIGIALLESFSSDTQIETAQGDSFFGSPTVSP